MNVSETPREITQRWLYWGCEQAREKVTTNSLNIHLHSARVEPREAVVSERWRHSHSERPRGFVRLRVWRDTPVALTNAICTSGVASPVVLERLSSPSGTTFETHLHGRSS